MSPVRQFKLNISAPFTHFLVIRIHSEIDWPLYTYYRLTNGRCYLNSIPQGCKSVFQELLTINTHNATYKGLCQESFCPRRIYNKTCNLGPARNCLLQVLSFIMTSFTVINKSPKYFLIPSKFHTGFSRGVVVGRHLILLWIHQSRETRALSSCELWTLLTWVQGKSQEISNVGFGSRDERHED
jgi:hypothetical protein